MINGTTIHTHAVLEPLVDRLRQFKQENSQLEVWLKEREAEFEDCGTIGANLERCEQQAGILEVRVGKGSHLNKLGWVE